MPFGVSDFLRGKGEKLALYVEVYKMLINKSQKTLYKTVKK